MRGSIGGVTVGNGWMRNNPDLVYPENHENMDDATLREALRVKPYEDRDLNQESNNILKHAGNYSDSNAYNPETEKVDNRKIKVTCPHCKKTSAALCSPKTELVDKGTFWACADWKEAYAKYQSECKCGKSYTFSVHADI